MDNEMIERVARAIWEAPVRPGGRDQAIAAITAMIEPTDAMIEAGCAEECDQADLPRAYSAMVAVVLGLSWFGEPFVEPDTQTLTITTKQITK